MTVHILYVFRHQRWYWAVVSTRGQLLATCPSRGYTRRSNTLQALEKLFPKLKPVLTTTEFLPLQLRRSLNKKENSAVPSLDLGVLLAQMYPEKPQRRGK